MKIKRKLGMGIQKKKSKNNVKKRKTVSLNQALLSKVKSKLKNDKAKTSISEGSKIGLTAARVALKNVGGKQNVEQPRVIPIPKYGGILPLIPIFAGLSALGALTGGAAGVAKAVSDAKNARKTLEETNRHNKTMEAIAIGKSGSGLYLKPFKKGLGLYLSKNQSKNY